MQCLSMTRRFEVQLLPLKCSFIGSSNLLGTSDPVSALDGNLYNYICLRFQIGSLTGLASILATLSRCVVYVTIYSH